MDANPRASDAGLTLRFALAAAAVAMPYRLAPHYLLLGDARLLWNLMPVGALALFAGSRLRSHFAFLAPLGVMLLSDMLLIGPLARQGYSSFTWGTPFVYAGFAAYVLIGRLIRPGELSPIVIGGAALLAGLAFFLISNFGSWLSIGSYPRTPGGLLQCYLAGVPFHRQTGVGDLFFSALIFGVHAVLVGTAHRQKASAPA